MSFPASFLKGSFAGYRIHSRQFFSSAHEKYCTTSSGLHDFRGEMHCHFDGVTLQVICHFFLAALKISSLFSKSFQKFGIDFIGFTLFEIFSASRICKFMSFIKFGKLQSLFLSTAVTLWDLINHGSFVFVPQVHEALSHLFFGSFPLWLD